MVPLDFATVEHASDRENHGSTCETRAKSCAEHGNGKLGMY
jgi:hypothetical protein